jgi:hypothetical protein
VITLIRKIVIDGAGNAGTRVLKEIARAPWPDGRLPPVAVRDFGAWQARHADAGLVAPSEVGRLKAETGARHLRKAGWAERGVHVFVGDFRGCPRGSYLNSITFALADSHSCKHESVAKALQVGSPAIAIGFGVQEATVESFAPGGAQYCCVHEADPGWARRQPCEARQPVSTTQITLNSQESVAEACRLAVRVAAKYITASVFPGGTGAHLRGERVEWFEFHRESSCEGPHDEPFAPRGEGVLAAPGPPAGLPLKELIDRAGIGARYADRELAWKWRCRRCNQRPEAVHVVHPAATCPACGAAMEAGFERASGLTGEQLIRLNGSRPITLGCLGLADETVLRLTGANGKVIWVRIEGENRL